MTLRIKPRDDCKACHGTGEVNNWVPVPFGVGMCAETLYCDCVIEQIPDDAEDEDIELEAS